MRQRSAFFAACCIAATALAASLAACDSAQSRAQEAYGQYQTAIAAGDLRAARTALGELVSIKDDDPSYWQELGRIQLQLDDHQGAYNSFTRAHELDRSNAEVLAALTQLALASGNTQTAEEHAKQLQLVAPGHPAAKLAFGYVYLQRQDFDKADEQADTLLQAFPYESGPKLLKARILLARGQPDEAIALLRQQVNVQPRDVGSWRALMLLCERQNDWSCVAQAASRLRQASPEDLELATTFIDASFRSNDLATARRASEAMLAPNAPPNQVGAVLKLWARHWRSPEAIADARRLARAAPVAHQLAYATYFNEVGSPQDAAALLGDTPRLPLDRTNLSVNSVIATILSLKGDRAGAKSLFDQILAREPDHVYALRGRSDLEIRSGNAQGAIVDAQRLVSVTPESTRDRLLLARAYDAAGDHREAERTLWDAFHEIRGDFEAYEALRERLGKKGDANAVETLNEEFKQQRDDVLVREFI